MSDELDLERGDPERAAKIAELGSARSKRTRAGNSDSGSGSGASSGGSSNRKKGTTRAADTSVASQLGDVFSRLAEQLEARGDDEMADAIRKDSEPMVKAVVAITRTVPFIRGPFVVLMSVVISVLAFWHVGGILLGRYAARRNRLAAEQPPMEPVQ